MSWTVYGCVRMKLSHDDVEGLNVALNEATWLGLSVDVERAAAAATLAVLALPESGPAADDRRVQLLVHLGRVAASYRGGRWDDDTAPIIPLSLSELEQLSIERPMPVYGWEFFNREEHDPVASWRQPLSLDVSLDNDACTITLDLHHDTDPFLAVRLWFDGLWLLTPGREEIAMSYFIANGKRWWDAFNSGDPRTEGFGLHPLSRPSATGHSRGCRQ